MPEYHPANPEDRAEIERFLDARLHTAMFPRSNLALYGMTGDHPHVTRFWTRREGAQIRGLVALSNNGMAMPVHAEGDDAAAARALRDDTVTGVVGPAALARGLIAALGIGDHATDVDHDAPHFHISLDRLTVPDGPGSIVALRDAPESLREWFVAYEAELLSPDPKVAAERGNAWYERARDAGVSVILMDGDTPLAMTGLNAKLPHIVQIGGVYCPPALRGQHHARCALALHLAQLRDEGVREAVLFSANPSASRAYEAIGFQRIGDWTVMLLTGTVSPDA